MKVERFWLTIVFGALVAVGGCSDDSNGGAGGTGGTVDTSGACGIICDGGDQKCVVEGFDPADGLEACTQDCQAQWTNEQDCTGPASFVIECVDANQSCTTLDVETCGDFPSAALRALLDCIEGN